MTSASPWRVLAGSAARGVPAADAWPGDAVDDPGVLVLRGRLDRAAVARVRTALRAAVAPDRTVLVDMGGVVALDSCAVAVLVDERRRLVGQGGRLELLGLSAGLGRVLRLAGLAELVGAEAAPTRPVGLREAPPGRPDDLRAAAPARPGR